MDDKPSQSEVQEFYQDMRYRSQPEREAFFKRMRGSNYDKTQGYMMLVLAGVLFVGALVCLVLSLFDSSGFTLGVAGVAAVLGLLALGNALSWLRS